MKKPSSLRSWSISVLVVLISQGIPEYAQSHDISSWIISTAGTGQWQRINSSGMPLSEFRFGDFDGNGKADVFRSAGGKWYVSYDGVGPWKEISTSQFTSPSLRFGDFDGDGKADVFRSGGGRWYVSYGGVGPWQQINTSQFGVSELSFADFNGDGKTDVFRSGGGKWYVSYGGVSRWEQINTSQFTTPSLRFGDFDGDGKADVFRSGGGRWYVSSGGVGPWQQINTSQFGVSGLAFGDFDGDGKTDVFRTAGGKWYVSYGGVGPWQEINTSVRTTPNLRFADFDGDGKTDVFAVGREVHIGLRVSRFTTAGIDNARADEIFADATNILRSDDSPSDRACLVHFERVGDVTVFANGDGSIDTQAEYDAVIALPGNVKIVNQINFCVVSKPGFLGCAPIPGNSEAVVRASTSLEGVLWAHEYGHTRGLFDLTIPNRLMNGTIQSPNTVVIRTECEAFRK